LALINCSAQPAQTAATEKPAAVKKSLLLKFILI